MPGVYHTQINEVLLTALLQAFADWTGQPRLLIDLEGHGREEDLESGVNLSHTVGWFTTLFPVLLDLEGTQTLGEALKAIKEQVRQVPRHGIGYGILRYLHPDEQVQAALAAHPQAQVSFNYLGQFDPMLEEFPLFRVSQLPSGPEHSLMGQRSHLLEINGMVSQGRLHFTWQYSYQLHEAEPIERVAKRFQGALVALIEHCRSEEAGGYTPSDFPLAQLNQEQLDSVLRHLQSAD